MLTATVKTNPHRCKNSKHIPAHSMFEEYSKAKPTIEHLVVPKPWCLVPVELSKSGNDSSAGHSVNHSEESASAQGVQPANSPLCCCVYQQKLTAHQVDHKHK